MPSDPKVLMEAIQRVLQEHDVSQARVSLDLFSPSKEEENIQIYVEQHEGTLSSPTTASRLPPATKQSHSSSDRLLDNVAHSQTAQLPRSPRQADAIPRPTSSGPRQQPSQQVLPHTTAHHNADDAEEPRELDETSPGMDLNEKESAADALRIPDDLMAMLGTGGSGGQGAGHLALQREREERTKLLKGWVGKSTLLDNKKQKESLTAEPPKQFLASKLSPTAKGKALPPPAHSDELPELMALTPPTSRGKEGRVPTADSLKDRRKELARLSPSTSGLDNPPKTSLKDMLAQQQRDEARNQEGLKKHEETMAAARAYIEEVEADPERAKLVEVVKNPLTKKKPVSPTPPAGAKTAPRPNGSGHNGIQVTRLTLPEDETARQQVIQQLATSEGGRNQLSSKDRYAALLQSQSKELNSVEAKDEEYKKKLEAAIKYNESLGVKQGSSKASS